MTSRDRASSEPPGDAPDGAEGVAVEDGDGDEPELRGMRAVWRGMRDASDETAAAASEGDAAGGSAELELRMLRAARRGHRDAPGADRDAVEEGEPDADDGDEPGLRAMRAVWLTMRDEAPPDRGLAELLAAARHKAEAMQPRPTLWQRMAAALRRPPVFALAAAVVLIGGAVMLGRRAVDEMPKAAPVSAGSAAAPMAAAPGDTAASDNRTGPPGAGAGVAVHHGLVVPPERVRNEADVAVHRERVAPSERVRVNAQLADSLAQKATARPSGAREKMPGAAQPPRPARKERLAEAKLDEPMDRDQEPARPVVAELPRDGDDLDPAKEPAPPAAEALRAGPASVRRGASSPSTVRRGAGAPDATKNDAVAPPSAPDQPGQAGRRADEAAPPPQEEAPLAQLVERCESAAKRGDCATVRRMVGQISKTDRGYRERVAKGSAVAKCLVE